MNERLIIALSLIVLILVACSGTSAPAPDAQTSVPSSEPAADESPLSPPPTPTPIAPEHTSPLPDPASSPIEPPSGPWDEAVAAAQAHLANQLGVAAGDIEVTTVEAVEWPNTSLGCPEPGKAYAQVITPGYRIVLTAEGERYEIHTDAEGTIVVTCEP